MSLLRSSYFTYIGSSIIIPLLWSSCFTYIGSSTIIPLLWSSRLINNSVSIIIPLLRSLYYNQKFIFSIAWKSKWDFNNMAHAKSINFFHLPNQIILQSTHQKNLKFKTFPIVIACASSVNKCIFK
jgi:hypothetical protein